MNCQTLMRLASNADDYVTPLATGVDVAVRRADIIERVAPINNWCELAGCRDLAQLAEVLRALSCRPGDDLSGVCDTHPGGCDDVLEARVNEKQAPATGEHMTAARERHGTGRINNQIIGLR